MKLIVCKDYQEMSLKAALIIKDLIISKPNCILGLATGSTPVGTYKELCNMYERGEISFKEVKSVNLDEYYPIKSDNDQSYRYFMNHNLFDNVDINKENTHVPSGEALDPEKECLDYEKMLENLGSADLQLLGIGRNGHIGFNEPSSFLYPKTHKTDLTEDTILANSRFFSSIDEVPKLALTMGIGTILSAKKILILASGKEKKEAVKRMLSNVIDTMCPATLLSLHKDVTVICTEDVLA